MGTSVTELDDDDKCPPDPDCVKNGEDKVDDKNCCSGTDNNGKCCVKTGDTASNASHCCTSVTELDDDDKCPPDPDCVKNGEDKVDDNNGKCCVKTGDTASSASHCCTSVTELDDDDKCPPDPDCVKNGEDKVDDKNCCSGNDD